MMTMIRTGIPRRCGGIVDDIGHGVAVRQTEVTSNVARQRVGARYGAVHVIVSVMLRGGRTHVGFVTSALAPDAVLLIVDGDEDENVDEEQKTAYSDGDTE